MQVVASEARPLERIHDRGRVIVRDFNGWTVRPSDRCAGAAARRCDRLTVRLEIREIGPSTFG
jgi:hypothetical protein